MRCSWSDRCCVSSSLQAPRVCQLCIILRKEKKRDRTELLLRTRGTVTDRVGQPLFSSFFFFSSWRFLNDSDTLPEDRASHLNTRASFTLSQRRARRRGLTKVHTRMQKKKQNKNGAAFFLSVLMSLGTIKSLP